MNVTATSSAEDRAVLLASHRPMLEGLLRDAARAGLGSDLTAYVARLSEPTGYLLAIALQRRHGRPDPDEVLRRALHQACPREPVLLGVSSRRSLVELLETLSPRLVDLGAELRGLDASPPGRGPVRVLVAAGGAEIVPLGPAPPLHTSGP